MLGVVNKPYMLSVVMLDVIMPSVAEPNVQYNTPPFRNLMYSVNKMF
jgi:hypothetical protein